MLFVVGHIVSLVVVVAAACVPLSWAFFSDYLRYNSNYK